MGYNVLVYPSISFSVINVTPLTEILQSLNDAMQISGNNAISLVNVRRSAILEDSCRHIGRKKFNPCARISVRFANDDGYSEGAVSTAPGGPCREFLRLLMKCVNEDSGIFAALVHSRTLYPNSSGTYVISCFNFCFYKC